MKTKLNFTLLTAAAMLSIHSIASAQTPPPPPPAGLRPVDGVILQLMTNGFVVGNTGADRLCGGMDDDQLHGNDGDDTITGSAGADSLRFRRTANGITGDGGADIYGEGGADSLRLPVNRGLVGDPLGIVGGDGADFLTGGSATTSKARTAASDNGTAVPPDSRGIVSDTLGVKDSSMDWIVFTSSQGPYTVVVRPMVNLGIESDPFGGRSGGSSQPLPPVHPSNPPSINGDEGADVSASTARSRSANIICGGGDADFFTGDPMEEDALFQLLAGIRGYAGADELWGDNGTDSLKK